MAKYPDVDLDDLPAALDQLIEDAFSAVSRSIIPCRRLSPHEAIAELARLFETGSSWESRLAAQPFLRPEQARLRGE